MLRLTQRVSALAGHARSARSGVRGTGTRVSRYNAWNGTTAFSERLASDIRISTRPYSQDRRAHGHAGGETRLKTIRDDIAHHRGGSPYPPKNVEDLASINETYKATQAKFEAIDETLRNHASSDRKAFKRAEGAGNLLTSFHLISTADRIFLCTGTNCADGRPQLDGPLATALLAHSFYQVHKVPIILADRTNIALVRELLGKLNANAAEYIRYVEISAVNGMLVNAIGNLIHIHRPDAVVHIGTPGRSGNGLYYDAEGNFVGEYNMAVDQVMNLANALGTMTIALGHSATQAGMRGIQGDSVSTDKHAGLRASHQILGQSATSGALALGSLLVAAYKDADLCTPKKVEEMFSAGRNAQASEAFLAKPVVRPESRDSESIYKRDATDVREKEHARLQQTFGAFDSLRQTIHAERMPWPQTIEEQHLYGPKQRYVFAVDSSDGVLVAAKPFANRVRARSPYVLNMLLVADHKNAPYGPLRDGPRDKHVHSMLRYLNARSNFVYDNTIVTDHAKASYGDRGCELFTIVVDGIHYSAKLGPDGIVMLCNTACSKSLNKAIEIVKKVLGEEVPVHVIDLIDTTAEAILKYGGEYPVILSTQQTAENGAYQNAVTRKAKERGVPVPKLTVVACGDRNNPLYDGYDLAKIINWDYLNSRDPIKKKMAWNAIHHYLRQVPVNASKVFLCCTHFPALWELISDIITEYWAPLGRSGPVPLVDPVKYQADKTAAFLAKTKSAKLRKHREPRSDKKHFLPRIEVHTTTSDLDTVRNSVAKYSKDMEVLNQYLATDAPDIEDMADSNEPMPKTRETSKSPLIDTKGIAVTKVHFEKVPLKLHAHQVGVNEFGDPIETRETAPGH